MTNIIQTYIDRALGIFENFAPTAVDLPNDINSVTAAVDYSTPLNDNYSLAEVALAIPVAAIGWSCSPSGLPSNQVFTVSFDTDGHDGTIDAPVDTPDTTKDTDTGSIDTAGTDTVTDIENPDTTIEEDTTPAEITPEDTLLADTTLEDTATPDVGDVIEDSDDTMSVDTATPDTELPDTGVPPQPTCDLQVAAPSSCDIQQLAAGQYSNFALKSGSVYAWGSIPSFTNNNSLFNSPTPVKLSGLSNITSISATLHHLCAIDKTGDVLCLGQNSWGQLGNGTITESLIPSKVLTGMAGVSVGSFHSCSWDAAGKVYCWGYNNNHQLGVPTNLKETKPVAVSLGYPIDSLELGALFSFAQKSGSAFVWGQNSVGQLGLPTAKTVDPTINANIKSILSIAAGADFSLFRSTSCDVTVAGYNGAGQLGQGTAADNLNSTPIAIKSLKKIAVTDAGGQSACAITTTGALYCWGDNAHGKTGTQLPDATVATPTVVPGLKPIVKVAVGKFQTIIMDSACKVYHAGLISVDNLKNTQKNTTFTPIQGL